MKYLPRILLLCLAGLIAWRMVALGFANHYVHQLGRDEPAAADKALAWNGDEPRALLRQGLALRSEDPARSTALLRASYGEDPTLARALVALAVQAREEGDQEHAQALIRQGVQLEPANPGILKDAAGFWVTQGNLEAAMQYWSRALEAQPAERPTLYPVFLRLAESPDTRGVFQSFAASPPAWWDGFFRETARRALDAETVRALYAMRRQAQGAPPSEDERAAYIARLQKDGRTTEAYLVWVNGLSEAQRAHLGILNNGGFELEPTNLGFDWHLGRTGDVVVTTTKTAGIEGERALHLLFKRREKPFSQVFQPLFLDPGTYRLSGKTRIDSLDSMGGLKWVVRCTRPENALLGESERFLGSGDWHDFGFQIEVPATCSAQEIRLVSAGTRPIEHRMSGGIWFDAMALRKVIVPAAAGSSNAASGS